MTVGRHESTTTIISRKPFKVIVCLVTLVAFLFNIFMYDLSWAAGDTMKLPADGLNQASRPATDKELRVGTFTLPEYLGHVKYSWSPDFRTTNHETRTTIIHIQDAHCNYAAQHKISEIVEYLNKEYGIDTINLEGGAKDYDLSIFTDIKDKSVRQKAADYFVKEGLVNGAEYFAINNPEKVTLWGIEDIKLYIDNLMIYRGSLRQKEEVDKQLKALSNILTNLKIKIYSNELLDLDTKYSQYKAGNLEFKDYLKYLIKAAGDKDINIKPFTNIYLLDQTLGEEGEVDFKAVNIERNRLIDLLQKKLSKNEIREMAAKTVEFQGERISQTDFYSYIFRMSRSVGADTKAFPELQKYLRYVAAYDAIDKMKVMDEMETLENSVYEALHQNDEQRELSKLSKNFAILKNIFNISLTREDYKYYLANRESFNGLAYSVERIAYSKSNEQKNQLSDNLSPKRYPLNANRVQDDNIANLDSYREEISKFYEYSFKRDDAFVKNMRFSEKGQSRPRNDYCSGTVPTNHDSRTTNDRPIVSVLITGGFHTENLCEKFRKNNISYISIMPSFTNDNAYKCPYFKVLSGEGNNSIEELLPSALQALLAIYSRLNPEMKRAIASEPFDDRLTPDKELFTIHTPGPVNDKLNSSKLREIIGNFRTEDTFNIDSNDAIDRIFKAVTCNVDETEYRWMPKIVIHSLSIGQFGIPIDSNATYLRDQVPVISVVGGEGPAKVLNIYMTKQLYKLCFSSTERAIGSSLLGEIIDHEYAHNIMKLSHKEAGQRARFFAARDISGIINVSKLHELILDNMVEDTDVVSLQYLCSEHRMNRVTARTSEDVAEYEEYFLRCAKRSRLQALIKLAMKYRNAQAMMAEIIKDFNNAVGYNSAFRDDVKDASIILGLKYYAAKIGQEILEWPSDKLMQIGIMSEDRRVLSDRLKTFGGASAGSGPTIIHRVLSRTFGWIRGRFLQWRIGRPLPSLQSGEWLGYKREFLAKNVGGPIREMEFTRRLAIVTGLYTYYVQVSPENVCVEAIEVDEKGEPRGPSRYHEVPYGNWCLIGSVEDMRDKAGDARNAYIRSSALINTLLDVSTAVLPTPLTVSLAALKEYRIIIKGGRRKGIDPDHLIFTVERRRPREGEPGGIRHLLKIINLTSVNPICIYRKDPGSGEGMMQLEMLRDGSEGGELSGRASRIGITDTDYIKTAIEAAEGTMTKSISFTEDRLQGKNMAPLKGKKLDLRIDGLLLDKLRDTGIANTNLDQFLDYLKKAIAIRGPDKFKKINFDKPMYLSIADGSYTAPFGDHLQNNLIFINEKFLTDLKAQQRDSSAQGYLTNIIYPILACGITHELRHEAGEGNSKTDEARLTKEDVKMLVRIKADLTMIHKILSPITKGRLLFRLACISITLRAVQAFITVAKILIRHTMTYAATIPIYTILLYYDLQVAAPLIAALFFWLPYSFKGGNVLFSKPVLFLTACVALSGIPLYMLGLSNPVTLGALAALIFAHYCVSIKMKGDSRYFGRTRSWKETASVAILAVALGVMLTIAPLFLWVLSLGKGFTSALIGLLKSPEPQLRAAVVSIMEESQDVSAVDPLIDLFLHSKDPSVPDHAFYLLSNIKWKPDHNSSLLKKLIYAVIQSDDDMLKEMKEESIDIMIKMAEDENNNKTVRNFAIKALCAMEDKKAMNVLIRALDDTDDDIAWNAAHALGELNWVPGADIKPKTAVFYYLENENWAALISMGKSALTILIQLRNDPSFDTNHQRDIIKILGEFDDEAAASELVKVIRNKKGNAYERDTAISSLAGSAYSGSFEIIRNILMDKAEYSLTRSMVAYSMAKLGPRPDVIETFLNMLLDDSSYVHEAAANSLKELGWKPSTIDEKIIYYIAGDNPKKVMKIGRAAIMPLVKILNRMDVNSDFYHAGIGILVKLRAPEAKELFIKTMLNANNYIMRQKASKALKRLNWVASTDDEKFSHCLALKDWNGIKEIRSAPDTLLEIFKDKLRDADIRAAAVQALAYAHNTKAERILTEALSDDKIDYRVSRHVFKTLIALNARDAEELFIGIIKDERARLRGDAVVALGELKSQRALPLLIQYVKDENNNQGFSSNLIEAIGMIGSPEAARALMEVMVTTTDGYLCMRAGRALEGMKWQFSSSRERIIFLIVMGNTEQLKKEDKAEVMGVIEEILTKMNVCNTMRAEALEVIVKVRARGAEELLLGILQKRSPLGEDLDHEYLRCEAVKALEAIRCKRAAPILMDILKKDSKERDFLRYAAAQALGTLGDERSLPALTEGMESDDDDVRKAASRSIIKLIKSSRLDLGKVTDPKMLDIIKVFKQAAVLNIEFPGRFRIEKLKEIIRNRLNPVPDGRRLAIIVYPKEDWNGAFYQTEHLDSVFEHNRVMFYEANTDEDMVNAVLEATDKQEADIIIPGGHGNRECLAFKAPDPAQKIDGSGKGDGRYTLDFSDVPKLRKISHCLKRGGSVILESCSTGRGKDRLANLGNMLRKVFPQAAKGGIWTPQSPTGVSRFLWNPDGSLKSVEYSVPPYRAEAVEPKTIASKIVPLNNGQHLLLSLRGAELISASIVDWAKAEVSVINKPVLAADAEVGTVYAAESAPTILNSKIKMHFELIKRKLHFKVKQDYSKGEVAEILRILFDYNDKVREFSLKYTVGLTKSSDVSACTEEMERDAWDRLKKAVTESDQLKAMLKKDFSWQQFDELLLYGVPKYLAGYGIYCSAMPGVVSDRAGCVKDIINIVALTEVDAVETPNIGLLKGKVDISQRLVLGKDVSIGDRKPSGNSKTAGESQHGAIAIRGESIEPEADFMMKMASEPGADQVGKISDDPPVDVKDGKITNALGTIHAYLLLRNSVAFAAQGRAALEAAIKKNLDAHEGTHILFSQMGTVRRPKLPAGNVSKENCDRIMVNAGIHSEIDAFIGACQYGDPRLALSDILYFASSGGRESHFNAGMDVHGIACRYILDKIVTLILDEESGFAARFGIKIKKDSIIDLRDQAIIQLHKLVREGKEREFHLFADQLQKIHQSEKDIGISTAYAERKGLRIRIIDLLLVGGVVAGAGILVKKMISLLRTRAKKTGASIKLSKPSKKERENERRDAKRHGGGHLQAFVTVPAYQGVISRDGVTDVREIVRDIDRNRQLDSTITIQIDGISVPVTFNLDPRFNNMYGYSGERLQKLIEHAIQIRGPDKFKGLLKEDPANPGKLIIKPITIAILDKSKSLFENHEQDGFIGINKILFDDTYTLPAIRYTLLQVGISHELRHEAGKGSTDEDEAILTDEDIELLVELYLESRFDIRSAYDDLANIADGKFIERLKDKLGIYEEKGFFGMIKEVLTTDIGKLQVNLHRAGLERLEGDIKRGLNAVVLEEIPPTTLIQVLQRLDADTARHFISKLSSKCAAEVLNRWPDIRFTEQMVGQIFSADRRRAVNIISNLTSIVKMQCLVEVRDKLDQCTDEELKAILRSSSSKRTGGMITMVTENLGLRILRLVSIDMMPDVLTNVNNIRRIIIYILSFNHQEALTVVSRISDDLLSKMFTEISRNPDSFGPAALVSLIKLLSGDKADIAVGRIVDALNERNDSATTVKTLLNIASCDPAIAGSVGSGLEDGVTWRMLVEVYRKARLYPTDSLLLLTGILPPDKAASSFNSVNNSEVPAGILMSVARGNPAAMAISAGLNDGAVGRMLESMVLYPGSHGNDAMGLAVSLMPPDKTAKGLSLLDKSHITARVLVSVIEDYRSVAADILAGLNNDIIAQMLKCIAGDRSLRSLRSNSSILDVINCMLPDRAKRILSGMSPSDSYNILQIIKAAEPQLAIAIMDDRELRVSVGKLCAGILNLKESILPWKSSSYSRESTAVRKAEEIRRVQELSKELYLTLIKSADNGGADTCKAVFSKDAVKSKDSAMFLLMAARFDVDIDGSTSEIILNQFAIKDLAHSLGLPDNIFANTLTMTLRDFLDKVIEGYTVLSRDDRQSMVDSLTADIGAVCKFKKEIEHISAKLTRKNIKAYLTVHFEKKHLLRIMTYEGALARPSYAVGDVFIAKNDDRTDKYEILEKNIGGMSVVYKVRNQDTLAIRCLKILDVSKVPQGVNPLVHEMMFDAEADALELLTKKQVRGVVKIFDHNISVNPDTGERINYMVLEYIEGKSLRKRIDEVSAQPQGFDMGAINEMAAYVYKAARIVAECHRNGMIHRDIKPDNIMVTDAGDVRLIDFGLGKPFKEPIFDIITDAYGSPAYVAPEQLDEFAEVTELADLYSLGKVLYTALTGEEQEFGEQPMYTSAYTNPRTGYSYTPPLEVAPAMDKNRNITPELNKVIMDAIKTNPEERAPISVGEFMNRLSSVCNVSAHMQLDLIRRKGGGHTSVASRDGETSITEIANAINNDQDTITKDLTFGISKDKNTLSLRIDGLLIKELEKLGIRDIKKFLSYVENAIVIRGSKKFLNIEFGCSLYLSIADGQYKAPFGDHKFNQLAFINGEFLSKLNEQFNDNPTNEDIANIIYPILACGITHELRHEAGESDEAIITGEDVALLRKLSLKHNADLEAIRRVLSSIATGPLLERLNDEISGDNSPPPEAGEGVSEADEAKLTEEDSKLLSGRGGGAVTLHNVLSQVTVGRLLDNLTISDGVSGGVREAALEIIKTRDAHNAIDNGMRKRLKDEFSMKGNQIDEVSLLLKATYEGQKVRKAFESITLKNVRTRGPPPYGAQFENRIWYPFNEIYEERLNNINVYELKETVKKLIGKIIDLKKYGIDDPEEAINSILVYGSYMYGFRVKPSDMDIVVMLDERIRDVFYETPGNRLIDIAEAGIFSADYERSCKYLDVSLVSEDRIVSKPVLATTILGTGIAIYGSDVPYDGVSMLHVLTRAIGLLRDAERLNKIGVSYDTVDKWKAKVGRRLQEAIIALAKIDESLRYDIDSLITDIDGCLSGDISVGKAAENINGVIADLNNIVNEARVLVLENELKKVLAASGEVAIPQRDTPRYAAEASDIAVRIADDRVSAPGTVEPREPLTIDAATRAQEEIARSIHAQQETILREVKEANILAIVVVDEKRLAGGLDGAEGEGINMAEINAFAERKTSEDRGARVIYVETIARATEEMNRRGMTPENTFFFIESAIAASEKEKEAYGKFRNQHFVWNLNMQENSLCSVTPLGFLTFSLKFNDLLNRTRYMPEEDIAKIAAIPQDRFGALQEDEKGILNRFGLESLAEIMLRNGCENITPENIGRLVSSKLLPLVVQLANNPKAPNPGVLSDVVKQFFSWDLPCIKPESWSKVYEYYRAMKQAYTAL